LLLVKEQFMSGEWTERGAELAGPHFAGFQTALAEYNATRFSPGLPEETPEEGLLLESCVAAAEIRFVESIRRTIAPLTKAIPADVDSFIKWFEALQERGPGQNDPLFLWLAGRASLEQMTWFLSQEVAGEAGFEDLLALTQVRISIQAKLEMARNFWDEMGRGSRMGMHGPMLGRLSDYLGIPPRPETVVPEALALGNTMVALAKHRRYAFHSIGALGVIEMTAPTRSACVNEGLKRLGIPAKQRHYFAVHAVLDVKHSEAWNREVLRPLVKEDPRRARAIGEGAIMRLWHGARTFDRYRQEFNLKPARGIAA
jgi:hypothetical protein